MAKSRTSASESEAPPIRLRLKLRTVDDLAAEAARVYREARAKRLDVGDASRLINALSIMQRMLEGGDIERRIQALEESEGNRASLH